MMKMHLRILVIVLCSLAGQSGRSQTKLDSTKFSSIAISIPDFINDIGVFYERRFKYKWSQGINIAYVYPNKVLEEIPIVLLNSPTLYYKGISISYFVKKSLYKQDLYIGLLTTFNYKEFKERDVPRELFPSFSSTESGLISRRKTSIAIQFIVGKREEKILGKGNYYIDDYFGFGIRAVHLYTDVTRQSSYKPGTINIFNQFYKESDYLIPAITLQLLLGKNLNLFKRISKTN